MLPEACFSPWFVSVAILGLITLCIGRLVPALAALRVPVDVTHIDGDARGGQGMHQNGHTEQPRAESSTRKHVGTTNSNGVLGSVDRCLGRWVHALASLSVPVDATHVQGRPRTTLPGLTQYQLTVPTCFLRLASPLGWFVLPFWA